MMLDRLRIRLAWPDMALMPNRKNGKHWGSIHAQKTKAKRDANFIALAALATHTLIPAHRLALRITFAAPDKRRRDVDNLLACIKPQIDGIAQALGVDDSLFRPIILDDGYDPQKQGYIDIEISAYEARKEAA